MRPYRFVTNWAIEAEIDKVWEIISNFDYLGWWQGVSSKRIKPGRGWDGIGGEHFSCFGQSFCTSFLL